MTVRVREPYFYHSFDDHNDESWAYSNDYPHHVSREEGFGGFTLAFFPNRKMVGISICGLKDRFDKKVGRATAIELQACRIPPRFGWVVCTPQTNGTSVWVDFMLHVARCVALDMLVRDYPGENIFFQFFAPEPKPEREPGVTTFDGELFKANWTRVIEDVFEAAKPEPKPIEDNCEDYVTLVKNAIYDLYILGVFK